MKNLLIGNAPFFSSLSEGEQERISKRMHLELFRGGQALFHKGDESTALYLIKSGWVRLLANGGVVIASQGPGSLVGETDLFLERPRTLGAAVANDAELWVLSREDLAAIIAQNPQTGIALSLAFGSRLPLLDRHLVQNRLKALPFLAGLQEETLAAIARRLIPVQKSAGEFVVHREQPAEAMFIVETGRVHLQSSEEGGDFAELGGGETFGEMALLTGKPHAHSVKAATDAVLWALPASEFATLAEEHPEIRLALSRNIREPLVGQDKMRAGQRLARVPLFSGLPEEILWAVAERLLVCHVPAGEKVFSEGDAGDSLYVIDSGEIEIVSPGRGGGTVLARMGPDEFFGEMALLMGKPRSSGARAATHSNLWVLYRSDFDDLINRYPAISLALSRVLSERLVEMDRRFAESHLRVVKLLSGLSSSQLDDVSRRLKPVRFRQGEVILREGEPGDEMYFVESGRVKVVRGAGREVRALAELGAGDVFGEMALLTGNPRSATVIALSEVNAWTMARADFEDMVATYPNLALALSRLLSERLRSADECFLKAAAEPAVRPQPPAAVPRARQALPEARPARREPPARPAVVEAPAPRPVVRAAAAETAVRPVPRKPPARRAAAEVAVRPAAVTAEEAIDTIAVEPEAWPIAAEPEARPRRVRGEPAPGLLSGLSDAFANLVGWYGGLSRGAKVRLVLIALLLIWLIGIATPALLISTLASSNVKDLRGAIAFVQANKTYADEAPSSEPVAAAQFMAAPEPNAPPPGAAAEAAAPAAPAATPEAQPEMLKAEPASDAPASAEEPQVEPTATPWIIVITNTPLPPTETPLPPTPEPTRRPKQAAAAGAPPPPTVPPPPEHRPQRPRVIDPRIAALNVHIEEAAGLKPGQQYWRLIEVRWQNKEESGNDHTIYIEVLDENGKRVLGQAVQISWPQGQDTVYVEDKAPPVYGANYPMYGTLGSYSVSIPGLPSDRIVGLGMGTPEQPAFTIHTNFFLIFQKSTW